MPARSAASSRAEYRSNASLARSTSRIRTIASLVATITHSARATGSRSGRGAIGASAVRTRDSSTIVGVVDHPSRSAYIARESATCIAFAATVVDHSRGTAYGSRHAASSSSTSGCSPPVTDAPVPSRRARLIPLGVSHRAVVSLSDNSFDNGTTRCTTPLPYVGDPIRSARS